MVQGLEEFAFTAPVYKQNIYSGIFDEYDDFMSPLDFFDIDLEEYPLAKDAIIFK